MAKPKVACQLIVFGRDAITNRLQGVFEDLAAAGYQGAETGDLSAQISASALKDTLAKLNLGLAGCHTGFQAKPEAYDKLIAYAKDAGTKWVIVSGVGDRKRGMAAYEDAAKVFNEVGKRCKDQGMVFCYHNHSWEFEKFDGKTALVRLYELTDPSLVKLCVDMYWVQHGGESPAAFTQKHLSRIALVHFKDMAPTPDRTFIELGRGTVDFPSVCKALSAANLEWVTVEQDRSTLPAKESVTISRKYVKDKLGL